MSLFSSTIALSGVTLKECKVSLCNVNHNQNIINFQIIRQVKLASGLLALL